MKKGMVKSLIAVASVLTASCAAFAADCDVLVVGGGTAREFPLAFVAEIVV